jgi:hypothetical protein
VDDALSGEKARGLCSRTVIGRVAAPIFDKCHRHAARRRRSEPPLLIDGKLAERRFAEPHCPFQHRVEHRCQVAGRAVDYFQDLRSRGLLFQRLARFGDQPCVLDRNDGLIGEGADKFNLPIGEWRNLLSREGNNADRRVLAHQRHAQNRTRLPQSDRFAQGIFRISGDVGDLHNPPLKGHPLSHGRTARR